MKSASQMVFEGILAIGCAVMLGLILMPLSDWAVQPLKQKARLGSKTAQDHIVDANAMVARGRLPGIIIDDAPYVEDLGLPGSEHFRKVAREAKLTPKQLLIMVNDYLEITQKGGKR